MSSCWYLFDKAKCFLYTLTVVPSNGSPFGWEMTGRRFFFDGRKTPWSLPWSVERINVSRRLFSAKDFQIFFFVCLFLVLQLLILWFIVFFRCCLGYCGDIIRIARVCRLWFEPSSFSISALLYTTCRLSSLRLHQKQDPVFYPSPKRKDFRSYTLFIFKIIIKTNKKKIRWSIVISNRLSAAGYTSVVYPSVFFSSRL
jgi:hypothetical protein